MIGQAYRAHRRRFALVLVCEVAMSALEVYLPAALTAIMSLWCLAIVGYAAWLATA